MSHFRLEAREASMRARRDNYTSSVDFMEQNWIVFVDKPLERLLSGWTSTLTMLHAITSLNSMVTDNTSFARWMEIWASSRTDPAEKSQSGISNSASKSKDLALNLGMCDGLISRCFTGMDETQRGQITTSIAGYWLALTRHAGNLIRAESCYGDEMVLLELIRAISRYSWLEPRHYFESAGIGHPIVFPIVTFLMKDHAIRKGVLKLNPTPATLPTLLQLYLASRQPLQRSVVRKGKANAAETITVNNYATEVATAVTSITALADQYVHKRGDPEVFKNLASFQQDLANIKLAEHPPLPHILKYSALAVGHQFTLINARCLEYGERLWNSCTIVPSFLFLFCAFQGLEDFKGSTVIDAVCTHLLRQGSKGVFTDGKPKKKFLKNFNLVIMDIELSSVRLSGRTVRFLDFPAPGMEKKGKPFFHFSSISRTAAIHKNHGWNVDQYLKDQKRLTGSLTESTKSLFTALQESINPDFAGSLPFNRINFFKFYATSFDVVLKVHNAVSNQFFSGVDIAGLRTAFPESDTSLEAYSTISCVLEILDETVVKGHKTIAAIGAKNPKHAQILRDVLAILVQIPDLDNFAAWLFLAQ